MTRSQLHTLLDLASDLKRISLLLYRGSSEGAKRFMVEALMRQREVGNKNLPKYLVAILRQVQHLLKSVPQERTAEDALMYSIRLQNYGVTRMV